MKGRQRNGAGAGSMCGEGKDFFFGGGGWWYIYVLMAKINGEGVIKSDGLYQLSKNLRGLWGNIWHFLG